MDHYFTREPEPKEIYNALVVLYRSFGRKIPTNLSDEAKLLQDLINLNIAEFLIANNNKTIVGLGAIFYFSEVCSIGYMGVLPEIRRKGLGTELFGKLINLGKSRGCKTFLLYASKLGKPIYHKFGFRNSFRTAVYDLSIKQEELQISNRDVKILKEFPEWAAKIDKEVMGFDRSEFLNIKLNHGSKLITLGKQGYALISGLRIGPLIAKNIDTAVDLIKFGTLLGVNHIILANHSNFPNNIFNLINLSKREDEEHLKMVFGKDISQKLEYFYALGTYAKG